MKCTQKRSIKKCELPHHKRAWHCPPGPAPETQVELFSPIITRGHSVIAFCYFATHFRALKSFLKDSTCIKYKDFSDIATGFIADK